MPLVTTMPAAMAATTTTPYAQPGSISIEDRNFKPPGSAPVSIPANSSASPYPATVTPDGDRSTVAVDDVPGIIVDLDLELVIKHPHPHGMDILLVGPHGQQAVVLSDAGASSPPPLAGVKLTLDDQAAATVPTESDPGSGSLATGDYKPTNHSTSPVDNFPGVIPAPTGASALSVFNGTNPNGEWNLFVVGDGAATGGTLTGWSLDFDTTHTSETYVSRTIHVSGSTAGISDVNVTLHGLNHTTPSDVDVMLVGPRGQRTILMSLAGDDSQPATGFDLTFDDEGTELPGPATSGTHTPGPLTPGTYRPADYGSVDDLFPLPAPGREGALPTLTVFDETDPNGPWQLFVMDTHHDNQGAFAEGWSLQIKTPETPASPVITSPASGSVDRDGSLGFAGTAPAGTSVYVLEGSTRVGLVTADGSGSWSFAVGGVTDGTHSYLATAADSFGNTSSPSAAVSVVMDKVAPGGGVTVNGGAATTNGTGVTVGVAAADPAPSSGLTQMRFSNDSVTWSPFEPYAATKAWTLSGGNGTKTVYAQFADLAGNVSASASDSIVLDTSLPSTPGGPSGPGAGPDTTKPKVMTTKPLQRATGVKTSANVKAVFSEPMQAASITRSSVRLVKPDGSSVRARLSYDAVKRKVTINPRKDLARRTTYRVFISYVRDLAGNPLDQRPQPGNQSKRWRFTTR
ncbi:MAG: Ig-like domain-containing protein [Actinomycetes bacterium]